MRHDQPFRASGKAPSRKMAATPERKLATCQAEKLAALMAAPPVENSTAAAASISWLRTGEDCMGATDSLRTTGQMMGGVIGASHQGPCFHVRESHFPAGQAEGSELLRRNVSHNRQVPRRRSQVLAERQDIDAAGAQVAHHLEHFFGSLAQAKHQTGFGRAMR